MLRKTSRLPRVFPCRFETGEWLLEYRGREKKKKRENKFGTGRLNSLGSMVPSWQPSNRVEFGTRVMGATSIGQDYIWKGGGTWQ